MLLCKFYTRSNKEGIVYTLINDIELYVCLQDTIFRYLQVSFARQASHQNMGGEHEKKELVSH